MLSIITRIRSLNEQNIKSIIFEQTEIFTKIVYNVVKYASRSFETHIKNEVSLITSAINTL